MSTNFNSNSAVVKQVQAAINAAGYPQPLTEDGIYGPLTMAGVKWLQEQAGVSPADGNITQDLLDAVGITPNAPLTLSSSSGYAANPTYKTSPASHVVAPWGPVYVPPSPPVVQEPTVAPKPAAPSIPLNVVNRPPPVPATSTVSKVPALVGAGAGAAAGVALGGPVGALIGATVGGIAGYLYENQAASKKTPTSIAGEDDFRGLSQLTRQALALPGVSSVMINGEGLGLSQLTRQALALPGVSSVMINGEGLGQPNSGAGDIIEADPASAEPNLGVDVPTSRFGAELRMGKPGLASGSQFGGELRAGMVGLSSGSQFGCAKGPR
jgi:peptidoglycan hydrolase-like protein with peptidoglycan-binding domain